LNVLAKKAHEIKKAIESRRSSDIIIEKRKAQNDCIMIDLKHYGLNISESKMIWIALAFAGKNSG
jgi:hypothetical protein